MDPRVDGLLKEVALLKQRLDNLPTPEIPLGLSLISETILSATAATVTFSGINQSFRHLLLVCQARTDAAAEADTIQLRFNADSSAIYDRQRITGAATVVTAASARAGTADQIGVCEAASSRASNFSPVATWIFGYARTDAEKWTGSPISVSFGDVSADTDLQIQIRGGRWRSTAAITSITLLPLTGPNFVSGSSFQLYGVR